MPRSAARRQERRNLIHGRTSGAISAPYPGFIEPCHAKARDSVPKHGSWLHEIKHDGSPYSKIVITPIRAAAERYRSEAGVRRSNENFS